MSTPKLRFFDSPQLPSSDPAPPKQQSVCPSNYKEPAPNDLRWMRVQQWLSAKALSTNTQRSYTKELKRFWHWIDKPWNQITTLDITCYKKYLETATIQDTETELPRRQFSPNSVALAVRSLKSFFRWLQQAYYITENPTLAVSAPSEPEPESKELTDFQVQALYAALERRGASRLRDTALLAVLSHGLRAEEAVRLNIEDYDGKRLHIREAKQGSTGRVPLDKDARTALNTYLTWRKAQGEFLTPDTPLFVNFSRNSKVRGLRLSYDGVYLIVKQLGQLAIQVTTEDLKDQVEAADIKQSLSWEITALAQIHPHQLRHTFASNLVLDGMDAYLAMALTRHRSVSTFKRYSSKARQKQAERVFHQMRGEELDDK